MAVLETHDYSLEIAKGKVKGHSHINKFGRNPDVDTAAAEDIWGGGGMYVTPTQARVHNIASTSAQDAGTLIHAGTLTSTDITRVIDTSATFITDSVAEHDVFLNDTTQDHSLVKSVDSETQLTIHTIHHGGGNCLGDDYRIVTPAGTGAAVMHVKDGLDANMELKTEFIILNGTSNVATTNSYLRMNRAHIHGTGSASSNVGIITATAVTDATVTAYIAAGQGQTLQAFYTVPRGKTGFITGIYASINRSGGATALADIAVYQRLWADAGVGTSDGENIFGYFGVSVNGGALNRKYDPHMHVSEFADVWIRCEGVSVNDSDISAGFDIILVDN